MEGTLLQIGTILIALCIRDEIGRYKHRRATKAYDNYMSYPTRPEESARSEVILPMARALRTNILAGVRNSGDVRDGCRAVSIEIELDR